MADDRSDSTAGGIANRLWRVEQRQADVLIRLDKFEAKIEALMQEQRHCGWKIEALEEKLDRIEKARDTLGRPIITDSPMVKTILYALLAMVGALATGQFVKLLGWLGS